MAGLNAPPARASSARCLLLRPRRVTSSVGVLGLAGLPARPGDGEPSASLRGLLGALHFSRSTWRGRRRVGAQGQGGGPAFRTDAAGPLDARAAALRHPCR